MLDKFLFDKDSVAKSNSFKSIQEFVRLYLSEFNQMQKINVADENAKGCLKSNVF